MLTGIPLLHYFKNKNDYSGSHSGMRYLLSPGKQKITADDGTETEQAVLKLTIWPDPWALERTDPTLHRVTTLPMSDDGLAQAEQLLRAAYESDKAYWDNLPGILDCDPWYPAPAEEDTE